MKKICKFSTESHIRNIWVLPHRFGCENSRNRFLSPGRSKEMLVGMFGTYLIEWRYLMIIGNDYLREAKQIPQFECFWSELLNFWNSHKETFLRDEFCWVNDWFCCMKNYFVKYEKKYEWFHVPVSFLAVTILSFTLFSQASSGLLLWSPCCYMENDIPILLQFPPICIPCFLYWFFHLLTP